MILISSHNKVEVYVDLEEALWPIDKLYGVSTAFKSVLMDALIEIGVLNDELVLQNEYKDVGLYVHVEKAYSANGAAFKKRLMINERGIHIIGPLLAENIAILVPLYEDYERKIEV